MPLLFAAFTRASKSDKLPSSGFNALCPPSFAPIAHGLPTSPGCAATALFFPLRAVVPMGCTGGR